MTLNFLEKELKEINKNIDSIDPEKTSFNFLTSYMDYFKNIYVIILIIFLIVVSVLYYIKPKILIKKDDKLNYMYLVILSIIIVLILYFGYTFLKKYKYI